MTLAQLDALMALHEKSTPGTWSSEWDYDDGDRIVTNVEGRITHHVARGSILDEDLAFIIAAHNQLPALAAEYRRMAEALEEIKERGNKLAVVVRAYFDAESAVGSVEPTPKKTKAKRQS